MIWVQSNGLELWRNAWAFLAGEHRINDTMLLTKVVPSNSGMQTGVEGTLVAGKPAPCLKLPRI